MMRESTPHLYLSAMPQTPSNSPIRQLWINHLQNHLSVSLGHPLSWPAEILTLQGHTWAVNSVGYSPDGSHIVSGSLDKTIRIWNPTTGQCIAGPFQGHTDGVNSVAYSPDGSHIVSGSWDKTIRVWNPTTGQCIAGPFQGNKADDLSVKDGLTSFKFREMCQQKDGWIELSNGACFCWVPPWGRHVLYLPINSLIISPCETYKPDYSNFLHGESWVSCWK